MQDTPQPVSSGNENRDYKGNFNGGEGRPITVDDAAQKTALFREKFPGQIKANFYGRNIIEKILHQPGCMGIRIYNGVNQLTGNLEAVLVGANSDQQDIFKTIGTNDGGGKGSNVLSAAIASPAAAQPIAQPTPATIAGGGAPCPTCCDPTSPLTGTPS